MPSPATTLTPNDSRALFSLDPRTGRSMQSLADEWQCDPSNATFIVDRLEELRLARRQPLLHDKRVKLVVLTLIPKKRARICSKSSISRRRNSTAWSPRPEALERMLAKLAPDSSAAVA